MLNWNSFNDIWNKGISPLLDYYCERINGLSLKKSKDGIKDDIWKNYEKYNNECRNYMKKGIERLDRHKVSSCYIFAIIESDPFINRDPIEDEKIYVAIEQLAITIGLKILQGFLTSKNDRNNEPRSADEYERDVAIFGDGFVFPEEDEVGHGVYRNNFATELYFTAKEKKYNVLSLSHSLYLLEMYNRMRWMLNSQEK